MGRLYRETPAQEAVKFAFEHLEELARLLHGSGHRDMALLLDAFGDLHELAQRRAAKGETESLIGPGSDTLDYVMAQMSELADMLGRQGLGDAALLFRVPGQLRTAAEARTYGISLSPPSNDAAPGRPFRVEDLKLSIRSSHRGEANALAS